jgi:hypothetical protein
VSFGLGVVAPTWLVSAAVLKEKLETVFWEKK